MADRLVRGPDGITHRFPADATDEEISTALSAPSRPADAPATQKRSWVDMAVEALPTVGGIAGGIAGGIGGTVAGVGVGGVPGAVGGATLGGGAGEALKQLINRVRGEDVPESPLEAATDIGTQGAIQGGAEALGGAVTKGVTTGAKAVYRGYLKPALSARMLPKANQIVQTALDEALPISRGGEQTANRVIGELRKEVDGIIANTPGAIDLKNVADRVRGFARRRYFKPGADLADYQQALAVADKIDGHPSLGIPPGAKPSRVDVPLTAANETKRALDTSIKETGFGVPTGAKRSTEKFARNELRVGLEAKAPAVGALNARESKLIDAAKTISRAVEREANQNQLYGVKTLVAGGAGGLDYARDRDPAAAATTALATRAVLHPAVASRIAIVANRLSKELGIGTASATRLATYVLENSAEEKPED